MKYVWYLDLKVLLPSCYVECISIALLFTQHGYLLLPFAILKKTVYEAQYRHLNWQQHLLFPISICLCLWDTEYLSVFYSIKVVHIFFMHHLVSVIKLSYFRHNGFVFCAKWRPNGKFNFFRLKYIQSL